MVNKPRIKGTAAETAVVTYLRDHGWPHAERRSLNGATDKGDVTGCPGLCFEVKYANFGIRMASWLEETTVETFNARAEFGVLVVKPLGLGETRVGQWFAIMPAGEFQRLAALKNSEQPYIVDGEPTLYTEKNLRWSMTAGLRRTASNEVLALTMRPPGQKDNPENWYRVLPMEHMVKLLRAAGFGDPVVEAVEPTEVVSADTLT